MTSLRIPRDLTPGEHAALAAAERIAELEALTSNLEEQNDRVRGERDTAQMRLKLLSDRIAQMQPVQDVANKLDTLTRQLDAMSQWLTAMGLDVETRLSNIEANLPV
jgi:DNA repair ATPase RecN